jgi:peroxiredoxin
MKDSPEAKIRTALISVMLYYEIFALGLLLLPADLFPLIGLLPTTAIWPLRLAAIMVGVSGLGLIFPLRDPLRHWAITALIASGQIALPVASIMLVLWGDLPAPVGVPMALVDCLFFVPSILALIWTIDLHAKSENQSGERRRHLTTDTASDAVLSVVPDGTHRSIAELSDDGSVLILLLRHLGCTFCRKSLKALSEQNELLEGHYRHIVIVTMSPLEEMLSIRTRYHLPSVLLVSDPDRTIYRALEIPRGTARQTLGWGVLKEGLWSGLLFRHGIGTVRSDPFQLSGSAIIEKRSIVAIYPTENAAADVVATSDGSCML